MSTNLYYGSCKVPCTTYRNVIAAAVVAIWWRGFKLACNQHPYLLLGTVEYSLTRQVLLGTVEEEKYQ